jgi:hypothetical protein
MLIGKLVKVEITERDYYVTREELILLSDKSLSHVCLSKIDPKHLELKDEFMIQLFTNMSKYKDFYNNL